MEYAFTVWYVILALLGFGFVIFIHELGHFLFAKWAGVQVERFSIGFGPVLLKKQIGETEYALSLLPLGGYVKMLGQEDTPTAVSAEAKVNPRSYLAKNRGWQALILIGGVLFNLISSYVLLLGLAWYGMPVHRPVVGSVEQQIIGSDGKAEPSPARQLGLRQGDRIVSVNGHTVRGFEDVMMGVIDAGASPITMVVQRDGKEIALPTEEKEVRARYNAERGFALLGMTQATGWRIMDVKRADGAVRADDPKRYERIVAIEGQALSPDTTGQQIEARLSAFWGKPVRVTLEHEGKQREATITYAGWMHPGIAALGLVVRVGSVVTDSPAAQAGVLPGDVLVALNDAPLTSSLHFLALAKAANAEGRPMKLTVMRDGSLRDMTVQGSDQSGQRLIGIACDEVNGFLPTVPAGGGLAVAGLVPGEALAEVTDRKDGGFDLLVIGGAERVVIPLSGLPQAAIKSCDRLVGATVGSTGEGRGFPVEGHLQLTLKGGRAVDIDLKAWPENIRSVVLSGLKAKDRIVDLVPLADGSKALEIARGGNLKVMSIPPRDVGVALAFDAETEPYRLTHWTEAFTMANDSAVQMVTSTLSFIPRFFKSGDEGGINPNKALSGPLGIFDLLRKSVEVNGYSAFLRIVAIIGLNLFLINLLPIPITDGGQLVMLGIEAIIRRPLPDMVRSIFMWIGLILVGSLMIYVIGLDVLRKFGLL